MNYKFKIIVVSLVVFILLLGILITGFMGVNFIQAYNFANEADNLAKVEKYNQSIEKYALALSKWSPEKYKQNISQKLIATQKLDIEKSLYDKGSGYFEADKFDMAKESFNSIPEDSAYYTKAQEKLKVISQAMEKKNNQTKKLPVQKDVSVSTSASNPNKDSLCRNEAEIYKISQKQIGIDILRNKTPEIFYTHAQWLARGYSESDLIYVESYYKDMYNRAMVAVDDAVQQEYLQRYNECLSK